ncbi:uncharacterized protein LOC127850463 isoform X2 [Dreissena polymorpha]|uniref:GRIP domain-containing protein n=1 Tax=Dreissena polymorpha TaxID=45954 RepID=A0A9D4D9R7_DREPO|nr:uncharacterized protein LOC127850463 isoform X2 [Dreissena polymorpha]KAH3740759.1 hypothetical protein DPMN_047470 [Dreissena polymorpha]
MSVDIEKQGKSLLNESSSLSLNNSFDSLNRSGDDFVFDDDIMLSPDARATCDDSLEEDCMEPKTKHSAKRSGYSPGKVLSKNSHMSDVNGNKQLCIESSESSDLIEHGVNLIESQSKQRNTISKSKTYDVPRSVYHAQCVGRHRHSDDIESNISMSTSTSGTLKSSNSTDGRNHVFLNSHECMVVPGCSKLPRETIASRLRYEKQGTKEELSHGVYLTPSQRKDILIRDLKRQIKEFQVMCEEKDRDISMYKQHVDEKTSKLVQAKDAEIIKLRDELREMKKNYDDIANFCEESVTAASELEEKTAKLKSDMDDREREHQKIYLAMYKKGKDCARIEREEELERLAATGNSCSVTISELVRKLAWTELELAKWQTLKRQESYTEAKEPDTESYTTLRFLKDSFFHYITDEKDSDHHLRAIIKIFKFSDAQMEKIRESRIVATMDKKVKRKGKK